MPRVSRSGFEGFAMDIQSSFPAGHILAGYVTADDLAAALLVTPKTLRNWHTARSGPPFVRIGRRVLYPVAGVQEWIASTLVMPVRSRSRYAA